MSPSIAIFLSRGRFSHARTFYCHYHFSLKVVFHIPEEPAHLPNKNATIDTIRADCSVLNLCPKSLQARHFSTLSLFSRRCIVASCNRFLRGSDLLNTSANELTPGVFVLEHSHVHTTKSQFQNGAGVPAYPSTAHSV